MRIFKHNNTRPDLHRDLEKLGARDMALCMQCGQCSAKCPLSVGTDTFPRKIYRYIQLGLTQKLLSSPEPWLCYYCGECNIDCPRGAEPAETMMAARRWLITQYDQTGLSRRFYESDRWEIGAMLLIALAIILLFVFFHGPVITDRVSVESFAPVKWIEIGDLLMAFVLSAFLLTNAYRMYRLVIDDAQIPFRQYLKQAKTFVLHFATQKRWQKCGTDRSRWFKHFLLVTGYLTMMALVIVFIRWFQVDDSSWHFTSIFGYYATAVLLIITVEMIYSRYKLKKEAIHRYSHLSDWLFLILLFLTAATGIVMHIFRISGWPMGTYVIYVIHLAIAVPMLVIEVPFGKWSHLLYRPLAIYLTSVKQESQKKSMIDPEEIRAEAGEHFMSCMQCGICTSLCPWNRASFYSPRQILRQLTLNAGTEETIDQGVWNCVTCNICGEHCPRGIEIIDLIHRVRTQNLGFGRIPLHFTTPLMSLAQNGNPWGGLPEKRVQWADDIEIPAYTNEKEYCLFICCTTAYDPDNKKAGQAVLHLLNQAKVSYGGLGAAENCCGEPAYRIGAKDLFSDLARRNTDLFLGAGVEKILTISPHCLYVFKTKYDKMKNIFSPEHYTELLSRLLDKGRLKPIRKLNLCVTYHDPCYLGRHNGIYDAPRNILNSIPGLKLVEIPNNKERSVCCGGGGGGAWRNDPGGRRLGVLRVREALETGADMLATACPYCIRMLNAAVNEIGAGGRIVVCDPAELLWQSTGMTDALGEGEDRKLRLAVGAGHV